MSGRQGAFRQGVAALVVATLVGLGTAGATDWYVVCDRTTGEVKLEESAGGPGLELLAGPFPGVRTAGLWVQEHHPDGRCTVASSTPEPTPAAVGGWLAVCVRSTGTVDVAQGAPPGGTMVLWGSGLEVGTHPDRAAATSWVHRVCPSWRCDGSGQCARGLPPVRPTPVPERWLAGELVSTVRPLTATTAAGGGRLATEPAAVLGPGPADLAPLVATATEAAASCAYPAALASADHLMNFDPEHPWLAANHDTLRQLAARQQATERAAWQASSALQAGELQQARGLAGQAADSAVGCQTRAVSALLAGIDTAIVQERAARDANRRRAAAALLPGLVDLAGVLSGAQAGTVQVTPGTVSAVASSLMPSALDLCAFQLEYRDPASVVPTCTCPGYAFDPARFRCVR